MFIFFIPVFDFSHACKPYKSHLALFILSNKSSARSFIGIKIVGLYKKYCWDMITIMVILISMEIAIYFGDWIKTVLPINLLFFLLFVQLVYVGIRWYVKGWWENRGYV